MCKCSETIILNISDGLEGKCNTEPTITTTTTKENLMASKQLKKCHLDKTKTLKALFK